MSSSLKICAEKFPVIAEVSKVFKMRQPKIGCLILFWQSSLITLLFPFAQHRHFIHGQPGDRLCFAQNGLPDLRSLDVKKHAIRHHG